MEKSSKESVSADFSSAIELMLLDDLLCPLCSDGTEKRAASYVYPESMAEVIEKIQRDCCSVDLNVANLARRSAMSERTFLRKFRQATGMSPKHYILSYRMARARVAIDQDPGKPLAQIALDCGFYNLSHFSRLFSQFYGYVPKNAKTTTDL
ncbi:MAG TPA: helix-turn-helix domain-containing protein [Fibrobacteraceae bacterium]|nr:helix-turn-helix domain-containing protein [Fibrobacteraceae bacterium]